MSQYQNVLFQTTGKMIFITAISASLRKLGCLASVYLSCNRKIVVTKVAFLAYFLYFIREDKRTVSCPCICFNLELRNQLTDSHETWYEHHATRGHPTFLYFIHTININTAGVRTCAVEATLDVVFWSCVWYYIFEKYPSFVKIIYLWNIKHRQRLFGNRTLWSRLCLDTRERT
jgi:hypothetical protein